MQGLPEILRRRYRKREVSSSLSRIFKNTPFFLFFSSIFQKNDKNEFFFLNENRQAAWKHESAKKYERTMTRISELKERNQVKLLNFFLNL